MAKSGGFTRLGSVVEPKMINRIASQLASLTQAAAQAFMPEQSLPIVNGNGTRQRLQGAIAGRAGFHFLARPSRRLASGRTSCRVSALSVMKP